MKNEQVTIVATGAIIGLVAAMLVFFGNPANMGLCIACFCVILPVAWACMPPRLCSTSVRKSAVWCWAHWVLHICTENFRRRAAALR